MTIATMQYFKPETDLNGLTFTNSDGVEFTISAPFLRDNAPPSLSRGDKEILQILITSLSRSNCLPFPWTLQEHTYLQRNPAEKWVPYLIYRYKFRVFTKDKIVPEFPVYALIEPASACNLRCPMCFQVDASFTRKPFMGVMTLDLFKSVVDQLVAGGTGAVTLGSRGEPTLNKNLGDMLLYAADKFFELKLITNATFLTEDLSHKILQSNVNIINFSVDAHEKELFEKIRVNADFDVVLGNIVRFEEIRKKFYKNSKIETRVTGVKVRQEQDPIEFNAFWSKICDSVALKDAYVRWDTYNNPVHPDLTDPCHIIWERMYVWYDGTVNPCDSDYKSFLSPGNVKLQSIADIWNSDAYANLRKIHKDGERGSIKPCDRCGVS